MLYQGFVQRLLSHIGESTRLVLALSGGLDSRVLLHLLARFKCDYPQYDYLTVHVHHGLSENADHWLQQCQYWSQQADIAFVAEKVQLELGNRISLEQAARTARYQALSQHLNSSSLLLTAHHQSDQLETFLLALKRGSGPKGLSAMAIDGKFESARLLRPMLDASRADMLSYANEHQLDWIEDESNLDTRFDRNFIRHQVSPILRQRWPNIEKTVARSAALCAQQESLLNELLYERYKQMCSEGGALSVSLLKEQSEAARGAILRLWLQEQGFLMPSAKQLTQIWQDVGLAQGDAAPVFRYGNTHIGRHQQQLWVFSAMQDLSAEVLDWDIKQPLTLPDGLGRLELKARNELESFDATSLAASSIQTLSLPIGYNQIKVTFSATGIHAHPQDRQHGRSLKKLLQEYQIPTWQRQRIPFLVDDSELIAAAGLFVGKPYSGADYQLIWHKK
ncbi:tRNA lysidine(34) synthetase TilS [Vibrio litoralis]|uniref:tRNA lysidine(34) synthetase TilS n=1 Tax=Vibrio litoralis TaxID=335972 RepID=UPI00040D5405|nr:tRNA lysidine(34) synthetase TilS [Vibrio litoralis]